MGYKIGILALVALQAFTATALPPCVCTRNLLPVCGSDGNTYSNECMLNCEKSKGNTELTLVKDGPCKAAEQICICTYEYKPVCGSDGNTYSNQCQLKCETAKDTTLSVRHQGACSDEVKVAEPPCICTEELNEVCGSDSNTYANSCLLNCATAKDSTLSVKHQGACSDAVRVAEPPCICTEELNEVCGSDSNTYANPCLLNCATANDSTLSVKHQGACSNAVKVAEPPCICPDVLDEVCGTDGNSYDNACILNCQTAKDSTLGIKHKGRCIYVVNPAQGGQPSCACPRNMKPVCGSNGVTYNNECLLRCAGVDVTLARNGSCNNRS